MLEPVACITTIAYTVVIAAQHTKVNIMSDNAMRELLEEYCEQEGIHRFEGERGVENLTTIAGVLGYKSSRGDNALIAFLADNSGACEAIVEWIKKQSLTDWQERIEDELDY